MPELNIIKVPILKADNSSIKVNLLTIAKYPRRYRYFS